MSTLNGYSASQIRAALDRTACARPITEIIVHHTDGPTIKRYAGLETVRAFRSYHMSAPPKGPADGPWSDIGYHYLVGPEGIIWEGRPLALEGAHCRGHNIGTVGLALILDGNKELPTAAQIAAFRAIYDAVAARFALNRAAALKLHRDYNPTDCPGEKVSRQLILGWLGYTDEGGHAETDVAKWAAPAVKRVKAAGILKGDPGGLFRGFDQLTRQEFAVACDRLLVYIDQATATKPPTE